MPRFFNVAGPCRPEIHYTVDSLPRLTEIGPLIDHEQYFVLHAPRQTGKTTYLYAMMHHLNQQGRYTALTFNIQAAASGQDPDHAMLIAAAAIHGSARMFLPPEEQPEAVTGLDLEYFKADGLKGYLNRWAEKNAKPVVLFIDEADSLMDDIFLALLRQLRSGFELRPKGFPQSIGLVGLRDVRDYKIRVRPDSASLGTGSPFNIKTESLFMTGFTEANVNELLDQHTLATGQEFSEEVRKAIFYHTQGQPWLTNALARQIVEKILQNDFTKTITVEHVRQAREELIQRRDTHLDSLIDKLREPQVKAVAQAIINGKNPTMDTFNDAVIYTRDLGLISPTAPVRFANPIYQEIIPRVLSMDFQLSFPNDIVEPVWYIKEGKLDLDALLAAFQKFYRRHSEAWLEKYDFREVGRQLLVMAFLQRILNGGGQIEREMAVGNGRCDLWVKYGDDEFVIELKLLWDQWSREIEKKMIMLQELFGIQSPLKFRYVHDFMYGYDWIKWVQKDA
ncbi:MAG: ATP-binding protein, partial [SAR324 cluster bacterium]|nr:ATP-binding protein [SAR324 cluster bacterium]